MVWTAEVDSRLSYILTWTLPSPFFDFIVRSQAFFVPTTTNRSAKKIVGRGGMTPYANSKKSGPVEEFLIRNNLSSGEKTEILRKAFNSLNVKLL